MVGTSFKSNSPEKSTQSSAEIPSKDHQEVLQQNSDAPQKSSINIQCTKESFFGCILKVIRFQIKGKNSQTVEGQPFGYLRVFKPPGTPSVLFF